MADLNGYIVKPGLGINRFYRADLLEHIGINLEQPTNFYGQVFWFYPDGKEKPGTRLKVTIWHECSFDFDRYFEYQLKRVNKFYSTWVDSCTMQHYEDYESHAGHWEKPLLIRKEKEDEDNGEGRS